MCHESSGTGLSEVIGRGKGTVTLDDFEQADSIFVIGQNPGTNHPRMLTTLQAAARRGCRIVSVNPLFEAGLNHFKHPQEPLAWFGAGTRLACLHVPVRINGDVAFFKGVMKEMLEEEHGAPAQVLDHAFIAEHTCGFENFRAALDQVSWDRYLRAERAGALADPLRRRDRHELRSHDRVLGHGADPALTTPWRTSRRSSIF